MQTTQAELLFSQLQNQPSSRERIAHILEHRPAEHEWLDYKQCPTVKGSPKPDYDQIQLIWSEYLAAFANTEGGLLIFGIATTGKDTPGRMVPVQSLSELQAMLTKQIHVANDPPVQGVKYLEIQCDEHGNQITDDKGVLACFVPLSPNRPHRKEYPASGKMYVMRAGESCKPIPHSMLRQMFFPFSKVDIGITIETTLTVSTKAVGFSGILNLRNAGTATANDVTIVVECSDGIFKSRHQDSYFYYNSNIMCILHDVEHKLYIYLDKPLHPDMSQRIGEICNIDVPMEMQFAFPWQIQRDIAFTFTIYCNNANKQVIHAVYEHLAVNNSLASGIGNHTFSPRYIIEPPPHRP